MSEELYHQALVERAQAGRRRGRLAQPDRTVTLDNPLCGDRVTLDLKIEGGRVVGVGHQVRGCLLCEAAAETIGQHGPGKTIIDLAEAGMAMSRMLRQGASAPEGEWSCLAVFTPVQKMKSRHDCVLLPFEALASTLASAA
jgi:NifU-like protein involved in Fe-S cluster formation